MFNKYVNYNNDNKYKKHNKTIQFKNNVNINNNDNNYHVQGRRMFPDLTQCTFKRFGPGVGLWFG